MSTKLSKIGIVITGDNSDAQAKIHGTLDAIKGFTGVTAGLGVAKAAFDAIGSSLQNLSQWAQTAFSTMKSGLDHFEGVADRLGNLKDFSEKLDLDPGHWTAWSRGARLVGASAEQLETTMFAMRKSLGEAMLGKNNPFDDIGLSISKLAQMDAAGQLGAVFDGLNKITDPARRQAFGEDIFGKMFRSIDLLARGGSGGLDQLFDKAKQLGIVLDGGLLARVESADDAFKDVKLQVESIGDKLTSAFAPALERISKSLSNILSDFSDTRASDTL